MLEIRHRVTGAVLHRDPIRPLAQAELRGLNLLGAALPAADLRGADLRGTDLGDANLELAHFEGADLSNASLNVADISGGKLDKVDASFARVLATRLHAASLRGGNFERASLIWTDLSNADLRDGRFERADLTGVNMLEANAECANLSQTNLRDRQRRVQVGADVRVAHVLVELGLVHELRRLRARAAQDERVARSVERVGQVLERPEPAAVERRHVAQPQDDYGRQRGELVGDGRE